MTRRRKLQIRVETFVRTISKALFWIQHGHRPLEAWKKAQVTL